MCVCTHIGVVVVVVVGLGLVQFECVRDTSITVMGTNNRMRMAGLDKKSKRGSRRKRVRGKQESEANRDTW